MAPVVLGAVCAPGAQWGMERAASVAYGPDTCILKTRRVSWPQDRDLPPPARGHGKRTGNGVLGCLDGDISCGHGFLPEFSSFLRPDLPPVNGMVQIFYILPAFTLESAPLLLQVTTGAFSLLRLSLNGGQSSPAAILKRNCSNRCFIQANCAHAITSYPEVVTSHILAFAQVSTMYQYS